MQIEVPADMTVGELLAMARAQKCIVRALPDGSLRMVRIHEEIQEIIKCQSTQKSTN